MASEQPQIPSSELPDVLSACLAPFDDSFLQEPPPPTDDDERQKQRGRIMLDQHHANADRLVQQAITHLVPKLHPFKPPRERESLLQCRKPSPPTPSTDDGPEMDTAKWLKNTRKANKERIVSTPAEEQILRSLQATNKDEPTYEVNPVDEAVKAYARYQDELRINDLEHWRLLYRCGFLEGGERGRLKPFFFEGQGANAKADNGRRYSMDRAYSVGSGTRPGRLSRPTSSHGPAGAGAGSLRRNASIDEMAVSISPVDTPAGSRRESLAKGSQPGTPRNANFGEKPDLPRKEAPAALKTSKRPMGSNTSYLSQVFAAGGRDKGRDGDRERDERGGKTRAKDVWGRR